jgi:hypothetical protein
MIADDPTIDIARRRSDATHQRVRLFGVDARGPNGGAASEERPRYESRACNEAGAAIEQRRFR